MPEQGNPQLPTVADVIALSVDSVVGGASPKPMVPGIDADTGEVIDANGHRISAQRIDDLSADLTAAVDHVEADLLPQAAALAVPRWAVDGAASAFRTAAYAFIKSLGGLVPPAGWDPVANPLSVRRVKNGGTGGASLLNVYAGETWVLKLPSAPASSGVLITLEPQSGSGWVGYAVIDRTAIADGSDVAGNVGLRHEQVLSGGVLTTADGLATVRATALDARVVDVTREAVNLLSDPAARQYAARGSWPGPDGSTRARWDQPGNVTFLTETNPHVAGGAVWSLNAGQTYTGPRRWLDEAGLRPGQVTSAALLMSADSGSWACRIIYYDAAGAVLTSTEGPQAAYAGALSAQSVARVTIPAGAVSYSVVVWRKSGTGTPKVYWAGLAEGPVAPTPVTRPPDDVAPPQTASIVSGQTSTFGLGALTLWRVTLARFLRYAMGAAVRVREADVGPVTLRITAVGDSLYNYKHVGGAIRECLRLVLGPELAAGWVSLHSAQQPAPGVATVTVGAGWTEVDDATWDASTGTPVGVAITHLEGSAGAGPITVTATGRIIKIHYPAKAGGGTFTYSIDGAPAVAVNTDNAGPLAAGIVTVDTGSIAQRTVVLTPTAGTVQLPGVNFDVPDGTQGWILHQANKGGSRSIHWTDIVPSSVWTPWFQDLKPQLVLQSQGANNLSLTDHATYTPLMVDRVRAAVPGVSLVHRVIGGHQSLTFEDRRTFDRQMGVKKRVAILDTNPLFADKALAVAAGAYPQVSDIHLNLFGGVADTVELFRLLGLPAPWVWPA